MKEMRIELGKTAADKITGFSGTVTGFSRYVTGCDQYLLQPPIDNDGKHVDGRWFDDNRLDIKASVPVEIDTEEDQGACGSAPVK